MYKYSIRCSCYSPDTLSTASDLTRSSLSSQSIELLVNFLLMCLLVSTLLRGRPEWVVTPTINMDSGLRKSFAKRNKLRDPNRIKDC